MKKISVFLLFTTTVISISPMEMQRPRQKKQSESKQIVNQQPAIKPVLLPLNPLFPEHMFTIATRVHHNKQPEYVEPKQPVWLPLHDGVIQASYHETQLIHTCSSVELQPVYKQTNKSDEQEKKSLLHTNSLRPNTELMQKFFDLTVYFMTKEKKNHNLEQKSQRKQLICLIEDMNYVRENNINEDQMGQFAYNNKKGFEVKDNNIDSLFPLFFLLLKKYTSTVSQTGEQLPLSFKKIHLEDLLNPQSSNATTSIHNIYSDLDTYPAFFKLMHAIRYASEQLPLDPINIFIDYMYGNKNIPLHDYSQGNYNDLKNEFYAKAYDFLLWNRTTQNLYDLMQMIDSAKNKKDITTEDDLAQGILGFEPDHPAIAQLYGFFDSHHSVEQVKKRIALFCTLIKKYNDKRLTKMTPSGAQYYAYLVQKKLDIPVPDNSIFDENVYALAEFAQLDKGTELLKKAYETKLNQLFDIHYPEKK